MWKSTECLDTFASNNRHKIRQGAAREPRESGFPKQFVQILVLLIVGPKWSPYEAYDEFQTNPTKPFRPLWPLPLRLLLKMSKKVEKMGSHKREVFLRRIPSTSNVVASIFFVKISRWSRRKPQLGSGKTLWVSAVLREPVLAPAQNIHCMWLQTLAHARRVLFLFWQFEANQRIYAHV